jgi:hypothetical protein
MRRYDLLNYVWLIPYIAVYYIIMIAENTYTIIKGGSFNEKVSKVINVVTCK